MSPLVITALVLGGIVVAAASRRVDFDVAALAGVLVLACAGVLTPTEAFAGFSNEAVPTIAFLYVFAAGMSRSGAMDAVARVALGHPRASPRPALLRILPTVAAISGVFNDTPLVALLLPVVQRYARRARIPPGKLLMPLSFAALLGGTLTLIGTSNNIFVSGLMEASGLKPIGFFELTPIALPSCLVGIAFLVAFAPRLLPDRSSVSTSLMASRREFLAEATVGAEFRGAGCTIEEVGLRHLSGLFLFELMRGEETFGPVDPKIRIEIGDRLFFTGQPETIVELDGIPGLEWAESAADAPLEGEGHEPVELTITPSSPLIGNRVRDAEFRGRFGAAILAVHRGGERLSGKVGDIVLRAGDSLLVIAGRDFRRVWSDGAQFMINDLNEEPAQRRGRASTQKAALASVIGIGLIGALATGILPPVLAAGIAALAMIIGGVLTASDARDAVDWRVLIVIGSSISIGTGVAHSGLADALGTVVASEMNAEWSAIALLFAAAAVLSGYVASHFALS